jgi:hypothetical protein
MNTKIPDIAEKALEAFQDQAKIRAEWAAAPNSKWEGFVNIYLDPTTPTRFLAEIKRDVRNHNIPKFLEKGPWPILVIAETIYPRTREELQKNNVCYLETTGNAYIKLPPAYFIFIDHKRPKTKAKEINRAFTKTGLKVIFLFLLDENNVNLPYRVIAEKAGVALGVVNNVINGLKKGRLIAEKNKKELLLADKQALLDKWIAAFDERLKPTLLLGRFNFLASNDFLTWRTIKLKPDTTLWGGEPAGDLYTDNLNPEILTIYTNETKAELMKNYKMVPNEKGNIHAYRKFWKHTDQAIENVVPPILAYTDLINTGNKRCIETAQKLYEEYIKDQTEQAG